MINSLDDLLSERNLTQSCPLSALADTRIAIELDLYLHKLLTDPATSEPYVAAHGGAPLQLITHIESDLRTLERNRIKPVFVLSGITPVRNTRPFSLDDPKTRLRDLAWDAYESGDVDGMQDLLVRSASTDINDVVRSVLRAFRQRNVEFIVAPYLATAQLVSLERHPRGYAHSIHGSTTLLLFPRVDRVILTLNLAAGNFTYVSKQAVMHELGTRTEDEFMDVALLAGWDHGSTFPPLADGTLGPVPAAATAAAKAASSGEKGAGHPMSPEHKPVNLRQVADLVRQHRTGVALCHAFAEHPTVKQHNYLDQFLRSRAMIKYSLVVRAEDGAVLPITLATSPSVTLATSSSNVPATNGAGINGNNANTTASAPASNGVAGPLEIPSDLSDVFSHRFPDEVYLHLSRGLISHHVHTWLATGMLVQAAPLDNGDTVEYRRFVRESLNESPQSPNCVALALATSTLNEFWSTRKVNAVYWYLPLQDKPIPFHSSTTQQLISRVNQWNVPASFVEEELRRQNSSTIDIALCLGATGSNELASRTKTPKKASASTAAAGSTTVGQLDKKDEIIANVIWRMLELRGFLNHDHLHTPYARALHLALRSSRLNDKLQEPLYLILELIRAGALHANYFTSTSEDKSGSGDASTSASTTTTTTTNRERVHSGGPNATDNKRGLLLVMRCFSLLPVQYKAEAWSAPVSLELLVFNSFIRSLGRSMRHLVEMIASTLLLRSDGRRSRDDYLDIALSLPFQTDTNTGMGAIIKCYVEAMEEFAKAVEPGQEFNKVETSDEIISLIENLFPNVRNVRLEIQRGFRFWKCLMIAVDQLVEKNSVAKELGEEFKRVDLWLQPLVI
ncbi:unnamed protein product [Sympodiomycopsis kandeliae]